jgi:hypothetical protein
MKPSCGAASLVLGWGIAGMILLGKVQTVSALPAPQDVTPPESKVLDLAAAALGWPERTNGGVGIAHTVTSGGVTVSSVVKWEIFPVSYFYYAGNQPGVPFGETEGYQWGSTCSVSGGCDPPTNSQYFQFNFDLNRDGDNNIDTPAQQYLGFFCEVTVAAPEAQQYSPAGEVAALCTKVLEKAVEVRAALQIPACVGVVCPSAKCEGNIRRTGGTCDAETGGCVYAAYEDCGALGCNPGTGQCNSAEGGNLCEGVTCAPAYCEGAVSYSDPACDPQDGACAYFKKEDCGPDGCNPDTGQCNITGAVMCGGAACAAAYCEGAVSYSDPACDPGDGTCAYYAKADCGSAGCNPDTGRCNAASPGPCGGAAPLMLVPLALVMRRPGWKKKESHFKGGIHDARE